MDEHPIVFAEAADRRIRTEAIGGSWRWSSAIVVRVISWRAAVSVNALGDEVDDLHAATVLAYLDEEGYFTKD